jgi:hypothetical protein
MTATCDEAGRRQLEPMQARLDVRPLAEEVATLVVAGQEDERLKWYEDGRVQVVVGKILPGRSGPKQTVAGRRKRYRAALKVRLAEQGWDEGGVNGFRCASD